MDALSHVLETVFRNQLPVLIFLSLSWILVYLAAQSLDFIARKSLLRFPIYLWLQGRRLYHGIPKLRSKVFYQKLPDELVSRNTVLVGGWLSQIDRELSNLVSGKRFLANLLFGYDGLLEEVKLINAKQVALLEADQAFIEAGSRDPTLVQRGITHIVENPEVSDEEASKLLFHVLQTEPDNVRRLVLYLLKRCINSPQELAMLENIAAPWSSPLKDQAFETAEQIRGRLQLSEGTTESKLASQSNAIN